MKRIIHYTEINSNYSSHGGKATSLFFLKENEFTVPDFYLMPNTICQAILNKEIKFEKVLDSWKKQYSISDNKLWAIRSSASVEDGKMFSYAGLFTTEININGKGLITAINKVLDSYKSIRQIKYGEEKEFPFTIIIQEMLPENSHFP